LYIIIIVYNYNCPQITWLLQQVPDVAQAERARPALEALQPHVGRSPLREGAPGVDFMNIHFVRKKFVRKVLSEN
jgi:hypothetical protein